MWTGPTYAVLMHWALLAGPDGMPVKIPELWDTAPYNATAAAEAAQAAEAKAAAYREKARQQRERERARQPKKGKGARRRQNQVFFADWSNRSLIMLSAFLWSSIVAMMWAPCREWGPAWMRYVLWLPRRVLSWYAGVFRRLHRWHFLEYGVYYFVVCLSAQSRRYPQSRSEEAERVGCASCAALVACWTYTASKHAKWRPTDGSWQKLGLRFVEVVNSFSPFQCLATMPLAWMHRSSHIGFFSVVAGYVALVRATRGVRVLKDLGAACRCALVSAFVALQACVMRWLIGARTLEPFATGISVFGHVGFLAAVLVLTADPHRWWGAEKTTLSMTSQLGGALVVLLFFIASFALDAPGLYGAGFTFACLLFGQKTVEAKKDGLHCRLMGKYLVLCCLYARRDVVLDSLNPQNLHG